MNAPVCSAKGVDLIVRKIRDVARERRSGGREPPACPHAARDGSRWTRNIPPEHYRAVAEIIGYIMRLKRAAKPLASGGRPGHHISTGRRRGDDESVGFRGTMGQG